jgi:hypothetical protein
MSAVLTGNVVFVPPLVAALLPLVPAEPAVRLGVLLVLLVPCTDWFITFTHLGGGDTRRALAVTPINLLVQFGLLPVLLWIFMGRTFAEILAVDRFARVFITLIAIPLVAAYLTERTAERRASGDAIVAGLGWLPVPLLGTVVFLIAASQVHVVVDSLPVLGRVAAVFVISRCRSGGRRGDGPGGPPADRACTHAGLQPWHAELVRRPAVRSSVARILGHRRRRDRAAVGDRTVGNGGIPLGRAQVAAASRALTTWRVARVDLCSCYLTCAQ